MQQSEGIPTLRGIFVFWLPLFATWLMMSVEGPFLAAIIARLAEPKYNLAAYGVAFSFALIVEAPIIMIMSASTALVTNRRSYLMLRNFTNTANGIITVIMLFLGGFFLADGAAKYELDKNLARVLLKPFGTRPAMILLGLMSVTAVFSMFMSNTATTAMMLSILMPILGLLDEGDHAHRPCAFGAHQGIDLVDLLPDIGLAHPPDPALRRLLVEQEHQRPLERQKRPETDIRPLARKKPHQLPP